MKTEPLISRRQSILNFKRSHHPIGQDMRQRLNADIRKPQAALPKGGKHGWRGRRLQELSSTISGFFEEHEQLQISTLQFDIRSEWL
jgi:hypothetical protein